MIGFLVNHLWWIVGLLLIAAAVVMPAAAWRMRWPIAVLVAVAFAGVFWLDANQLRTEIAQRDAAAADATLRAERASRAKERSAGTDLAKVDTTLHQENTHAQADVAAVGAARDAGDLRLRDGLRCPAATAGVPDPAPAAGGGDAAEAGGLSRADEDLLVRLAADADTVARQLTACQATVRAYLLHFGEAPR